MERVSKLLHIFPSLSFLIICHFINDITILDIGIRIAPVQISKAIQRHRYGLVGVGTR